MQQHNTHHTVTWVLFSASEVSEAEEPKGCIQCIRSPSDTQIYFTTGEAEETSPSAGAEAAGTPSHQRQ